MPTLWIVARNDSAIVILYTLVFVLVFIVLPLWGLSRLITRAARAFSRRNAPPDPLPVREKPPRKTSPLVYVFLILMVVVFSLVARTRKPVVQGRNPLVQRHDPKTVSPATWIPVSFCVLLAGYLVVVVVRSYDRALIKAARQYNEHDLDGAIATLRDAIEARPTAARANNLAAFLMLKQDWPEAYKNVLLAGELGLDPKIFRKNLAAVLHQMGRPDEALAALEPHAVKKNADLTEICDYAHSLLELNRMDEALAQIARAEAKFGSKPQTKELTRLTRAAIDALRTRYEEHLGTTKPVTLDEL